LDAARGLYKHVGVSNPACWPPELWQFVNHCQPPKVLKRDGWAALPTHSYLIGKPTKPNQKNPQRVTLAERGVWAAGVVTTDVVKHTLNITITHKPSGLCLPPYCTSAANAIAVISRTPKHYFWSQGTPSGEALIMQEAPLSKKAARYIAHFSSTWQHIAAFLLLLDGVSVDPALITPLFARPETVAPLTQADIRQKAVAAGIPLETQLRREEGWDDAAIAALQTAQDAASERQQVTLGAAMARAQRDLDQNTPPTPGLGSNV
jgi:hypothetical protein